MAKVLPRRRTRVGQVALRAGESGLFLVFCWGVCAAAGSAPIELGTRLELFVDDYLIESCAGAQLRLQSPRPREVAIVFDAPWEGNTSGYVTVFEDDGLFRMYYRASDSSPGSEGRDEQRVCYACSEDGVHWAKPDLGLFEFDGSKANNIVWEGVGTHNFVPFKDGNPACAPGERYKAVGSGSDHARLVPFRSEDGIHWSLMREEPIITEGAFDSQNLAFWDVYRGRYVEFHRGFRDGVRAIMTSTTVDFLSWPAPEWLDYGDCPKEHLYTNAITTYPRAPHILMGFPKRFLPSRDPKIHRYPGVSDGVFMTSRDGLHWRRWGEAFIRPGLQRSRWVNRNNMTAWGILQTKAEEPDLPDELSVFSSEGYYTGPCKLRRFTVRLDGFVSVHAPASGGEFTTKLLTFADDPAPRRPSPVTAGSAVMFEEERAIHGRQALSFKKPATIRLPGTQALGAAFTLAVHVRDVPAGHRRLFSAYDGGGVPTTQGELYFDFDSGGNLGGSGLAIRVGCDGELVGAPTEQVGAWSGDTEPHHIAMTWQDGVVTIYFDGREVATGGSSGRGALELLHGDLQFGEDYPPTSLTNEPFIGVADDILVLRRVLRPEEMARIAVQGAAGLTDEQAGELLYTLEGDGDNALTDTLVGHGSEDTVLPVPPGPGETELIINYSTSAAGSIRCELLGADGEAVAGHALDDCDAIFGDHIERAVTWRRSPELRPLVGTPVRLRFVMQDADLYSIRFR